MPITKSTMTSAKSSSSSSIPNSVIDNLTDFHEKISRLEEAYKPILAQTIESLQSDVNYY